MKCKELLIQYFTENEIEILLPIISLLQSDDEVSYELGITLMISNNLWSKFTSMLKELYKGYIDPDDSGLHILGCKGWDFKKLAEKVSQELNITLNEYHCTLVAMVFGKGNVKKCDIDRELIKNGKHQYPSYCVFPFLCKKVDELSSNTNKVPLKYLEYYDGEIENVTLPYNVFVKIQTSLKDINIKTLKLNCKKSDNINLEYISNNVKELELNWNDGHKNTPLFITFKGLEKLTNLRKLKLVHLPKNTDFYNAILPVNLVRLEVETMFQNDTNNKNIKSVCNNIKVHNEKLQTVKWYSRHKSTPFTQLGFIAKEVNDYYSIYTRETYFKFF